MVQRGETKPAQPTKAREPDQGARSLLATSRIAREGLDALEALLEHGPLGDAAQAAIELIAGCPGRLIVVGIGKSGHIARKLAATFSSTGTPAHYVHPTEASHGDLGMIGSGDVILALSWSGETDELAAILAYSKRFGVPLVAITAGPDSTLARHASIALVLPKVREACPHNLAPTTSTALQLILGDALAIALLERRGFSEADFRIFHPGGKLGAQLRTVGELMHVGAQLPVVSLGSGMGEAIVEMTSKGFGSVGVVDADGALAGIITDGDLRRHMSSNLLEMAVTDVMTHGPITTEADTLAGAALKVMQSHQITMLFVVDKRRPVGVLHMLDLLRAGVA